MHNLINATPLYNFLKYCNSSSLDKVVLDCGAGGSNPPLSLFYEFSYKTFGIELSEEQIDKAKKFSKAHNVDLGIIKGDMTQLPYERESFSFLYSYNTSVHMKKKDFQIALSEFYRVLKPEGICYVNFLSKECSSYGVRMEVSPGEFIQMDEGEEVQFTHYIEDELLKLLKDFEVLYKEKRVITRYAKDEEYTSGYYDFILKKH